MPLSPTEILQAAATISKTTETLVGKTIPCAGYANITLFASYVKGDETGLNLYIYFLRADGGTEYKMCVWTESGGVYTPAQVKIQFSASANLAIPIDVRGIDYIRIYQGGSNNDGTPTGTLAASYTAKDAE